MIPCSSVRTISTGRSELRASAGRRRTSRMIVAAGGGADLIEMRVLL
jgi:hypothetical protein